MDKLVFDSKLLKDVHIEEGKTTLIFESNIQDEYYEDNGDYIVDLHEKQTIEEEIIDYLLDLYDSNKVKEEYLFLRDNYNGHKVLFVKKGLLTKSLVDLEYEDVEQLLKVWKENGFILTNKSNMSTIVVRGKGRYVGIVVKRDNFSYFE